MENILITDLIEEIVQPGESIWSKWIVIQLSMFDFKLENPSSSLILISASSSANIVLLPLKMIMNNSNIYAQTAYRSYIVIYFFVLMLD